MATRGLDPDLVALQEVRDLVERAHAAHKEIASWEQDRVDVLCAAMAQAGEAAAYELARLAVEETGIGRVHYKVLKNIFGTRALWASIKDEKTCGIVRRDERTGVIEVATPVGVVASIVPTTNPTSTALAKALISVKGRNATVISPHPRARRCIGESAEVLRRAIERAGGPPDLVLSLSNPTIESTGALMSHELTAIILATGGAGLVHAAYSSGKPAYGVGPGNVPCYVDRSADISAAARWITASQSFDNATLCCSEQALVLDEPIADALLAAMAERGAHLCDADEVAKLARLCNRGGHMNADVVGLDPQRVADMAGFSVPRHTTVLLAPQGGVGREWPLSIEILCPLLSVHRVNGWEEGCRESLSMLEHGGLGHTIGVWAGEQAVIDAWLLHKPAGRIVLNGPCSEGAVGYSTGFLPSMSLGCGPQAGNITTDNISARHLISIKRASTPRRDWDNVYRAGHEAAAKLTGDSAPRGSGLEGDPGLGTASAPKAGARAVSGGSNWQGNAAVTPPPPLPSAPAGGALRSKVQPALKSRPSAPTFTRPTSAPQAAAVLTSAPALAIASPIAPDRPQAPTAPTGGGALGGRHPEHPLQRRRRLPDGPVQRLPASRRQQRGLHRLTHVVQQITPGRTYASRSRAQPRALEPHHENETHEDL